MTVLDVTDLRVRYGPVEVLRGVGLQIDAGEVVGLLGPNGAGKSTLLRAISGLLRPSAGSVRFNGQSLVGKDPALVARLGLVQVPEARHIFPSLSVRENLLVGGTPLPSRADRLAALERVWQVFPALSGKARAAAGSLSGGQQQMLAVGRAMMAGPKMIMLDEPSLGLAPLVVAELYDLLEHLVADGLTILLVEQDIYAALGFVDRAYVLENGTVRLSGSSDELLDHEHVRQAYLGL